MSFGRHNQPRCVHSEEGICPACQAMLERDYRERQIAPGLQIVEIPARRPSLPEITIINDILEQLPDEPASDTTPPRLN